MKKKNLVKIDQKNAYSRLLNKILRACHQNEFLTEGLEGKKAGQLIIDTNAQAFSDPSYQCWVILVTDQAGPGPHQMPGD